MTNDKIQSVIVAKRPHGNLLPQLTVGVFVLLIIFVLMLAFLWLRLPTEGVKLHGTVDIGVDLLGTKTDLLWFGGFAAAVFLLNMGLAFVMAKRERLASIYLVAATGIVLLLLIGTMLFLLRLNRIM